MRRSEIPEHLVFEIVVDELSFSLLLLHNLFVSSFYSIQHFFVGQVMKPAHLKCLHVLLLLFLLLGQSVLGLHYVEDVRVAELNVLGGGDGTDAFVIEGVSGVVACF